MSSFREMDENKRSYKSYLLQQDWYDLAKKKLQNLTKHYMAKVFFKANRFRASTCTYAESWSHD